MAAMGHPIVGDKQYTKKGPLLKGKGLFLSAVAISFYHPETGEEMTLSTAIPSKFNALLKKEATAAKNQTR